MTSQLNGSERHFYRITLNFYRITLKKNKFVLVVVEQRGIDVALSLAGVGQSSLITVDSPNGTEGPPLGGRIIGPLHSRNPLT